MSLVRKRENEIETENDSTTRACPRLLLNTPMANTRLFFYPAARRGGNSRRVYPRTLIPHTAHLVKAPTKYKCNQPFRPVHSIDRLIEGSPDIQSGQTRRPVDFMQRLIEVLTERQRLQAWWPYNSAYIVVETVSESD